MTFALPGSRGSYAVTSTTPDPFVHQELVEILYHTLWKTVQVFFEHRKMGHDLGEAGFLYSFLAKEKQQTGDVVADVASSIEMKVRDDARMREQVAAEEVPTANWPISRSLFGPTTFRAFRKYKPPFITSSANRWRRHAMAKLELYGTKHCPHTQEIREWLEWKGTGLSEFDVDSDLSAFRRVQAPLQPPYAVPILVEDGKVVQVGWQ